MEVPAARYPAQREVMEALGTSQAVWRRTLSCLLESELKGWRNIRGIGITLDEAKELITVTEARTKQEDLKVFDWDLIDRDQENFDTKIMLFLFKKGSFPWSVNEFSWTSRRSRLTIRFHSKERMQGTLRTFAPVKRPWNKATRLPREAFDIRWVDSGLRVSVSAPW